MTRAARVLRVSQPTLTVAIRNLEQSLRTILFHRARNGVQLTATGRELLEQTRDILSQLDFVEQRIHGLEEQQVGSFVIGCHPSLGSYFLPRFLGEFWQADSRVELSIWTGPSPDVWHRVIARDVHFGLVVNPKPHPDLVVVELFRDLQAIFMTDAFLSAMEGGPATGAPGLGFPPPLALDDPVAAYPVRTPTDQGGDRTSATLENPPAGRAIEGEARGGAVENSQGGGTRAAGAAHWEGDRRGQAGGETPAAAGGAVTGAGEGAGTEAGGGDGASGPNPRRPPEVGAEGAQPPATSASFAQTLLRRGPVAYAERFDQSRELLRRLNVLGCAPSRTISCGDYELVKSLTAAGFALGILPERVARYGYGKAFRPLHPELPAFDDKIKLIYRADLHRTRAALALKESLVAAGRQMSAPESDANRS
ncbi:MAG: LysR family transcriptional regulator [Candidatus Eisenbacteria bacterium]|nr:LysR family transcriptional regulator [Candidatus Eisenbacteria bacterium]MCC7142092.1 LysR family transcriptional regulator [Candidatus Eisenbacteria bacterium]